MRLLVTALLSVCLAVGSTQITGVFVDSSGNVIKKGSLTIVSPRMTTAAGHSITPGLIQVDIRNGVFRTPLYLEPNDTATPAGTTYIIQFGFGLPNYTERWSVPTATVVGIDCGTTAYDPSGNLIRTLATCATTLRWSTLTAAQYAVLTPAQAATLQP